MPFYSMHAQITYSFHIFLELFHCSAVLVFQEVNRIENVVVSFFICTDAFLLVVYSNIMQFQANRAT